MPWVQFTADYDWRVNPRVTIAYRRGKTCLVSQACAKDAVERGKAVAAARPQKSPVMPHKDAADAGQ